jgi:hypothetical protein
MVKLLCCTINPEFVCVQCRLIICREHDEKELEYCTASSAKGYIKRHYFKPITKDWAPF